jgi:single-strand DNA-binding protein
MSGSLNKTTLIGNVCKEPEIRSTNDGREVANIVLATNETWKDKATGEKKEKAEFHKIACFNEGLINVIRNYVKKGAKLYIEGALQTRKWKDKDGIERYSTEIVLQGYNCQLTMLDKPDREPTKHDVEKQNAYQPSAELADDLPF